VKQGQLITSLRAQIDEIQTTRFSAATGRCDVCAEVVFIVRRSLPERLRTVKIF